MLMSILLLMLVKSSHVFFHDDIPHSCCKVSSDSEKSNEQDSRSGNDRSDCPICKYVISPFVEATHFDYSPIAESCVILNTFFYEKEIFIVPSHKQSRAPPHTIKSSVFFDLIVFC